MLLAFAHAAIAVSGCLSSMRPVSESGGCEEHQQSAPSELVCRTHLQAERQTLDFVKLPQVFALDMVVLVLASGRAAVPIAAGVVLPVRTPVAGAPPPPLNLLYSRSLT